MKIHRARQRGISVLVEAVVVAIMVISAFAVSYYYITPANPRLQRSQQDVSQLGYNILNSLAANGEFDYQIINGEMISEHYTNCSYSNPSVSISPGSQWNQPGSTSTYTVTVVNNDNLCGVELFQLSLSLPSTSWTGTIAIPVLSAASDGGSASTQLSVTAPDTSGTGTYAFNVTATNVASSVPASSASATSTGYFSIQNGNPCIQNDPTVQTFPAPEYSTRGSNMSFAVQIKNNDVNCGLETFTVSVLSPGPGWSVVLSSPVVKIYSGSSAATTVYLSSPNNVNTGQNSTRVLVTNEENVLDSSATAISYYIVSSNQGSGCTKAPSVSTSNSPTVVSGTTLTYSIVINNQDPASCGIEQFEVGLTNVPGFNEYYQPTINVAAGGSGGMTLFLTSNPTQSAGNTPFTVKATSPNGKSSSAKVTYSSSGPPSCGFSNPTISVTPPSQWGLAGTPETYKVTVVNNNLVYCSQTSSETYQLSVLLPGSGWSSVPSTGSSVIINPAGGSSSVSLQVTSPAIAPPGMYTFTVVAVNSANSSVRAEETATYSVEPPCTVVTFSCLGSIGAIVPGWQRNIDVALLSVVPEGYVYNLTVYLVYSPPGQPYNVEDISLNNGTMITNGVPQSFKNAGQVTDVLYAYTTPKLYVLLFQLQLAQVTSP